MLHREHVGVKVGDPLLALLSDPKVLEAVLDVGTDHVPIKLGVVSPHVLWILVADVPVGADLLELEVEGRDLTKIIRVPQLADKIGGPHESAVIP